MKMTIGSIYEQSRRRSKEFEVRKGPLTRRHQVETHQRAREPVQSTKSSIMVINQLSYEFEAITGAFSWVGSERAKDTHRCIVPETRSLSAGVGAAFVVPNFPGILRIIDSKLNDISCQGRGGL